MGRRFRFDGRWLVGAPPDAVAEVLLDLAAYPGWWPQVVAVVSLGPDDARVLCRSRLPYTLDLVLHAESRASSELRVAVTGDLVGTVAWLLEPGGHEDTWLSLDQEVEVSGVLGALAPMAAPLLRWNHHQMMGSGIAGLRRQLRRRGQVGPDSAGDDPQGAVEGRPVEVG